MALKRQSTSELGSMVSTVGRRSTRAIAGLVLICRFYHWPMTPRQALLEPHITTRMTPTRYLRMIPPCRQKRRECSSSIRRWILPPRPTTRWVLLRMRIMQAHHLWHGGDIDTMRQLSQYLSSYWLGLSSV